MEDITVSIICTAFNHEKYIRDALDGFLRQKTNFNFEVIIHDDASVDKTADIIREYQAKYPEIIKPIFQTENHYSKKVPVCATFMLPVAKGRYFAFCEGDDYWCDELKLQKQIDYLEQHHEYVACVHNTEFYYLGTGKREIKYTNTDRDLGLIDCVMSGGQSFHTSSVVVRRNVYLSKPQFTKVIDGVGDYPSSIYYSLSGKIRYIGDVMSIYRCGTKGSWSDRVRSDRSKTLKIMNSIIEMLQMADEYSKKQYNDIFSEAIEFQYYQIGIIRQDFKTVIRIKKFFNRERVTKKIRYILFAYLPFLIKVRNLIINRKKG